MYGVAIGASSGPACVARIQQAEAAGVPAAWATMGAAGAADMTPVLAAAAAQTERILLGNCIVHTWSRQPLTFAEEAIAVDDFGPGRFRLGIGPTTAFLVERMYGRPYAKPLTNLREYLHTVRTLLRESSVKFEGEHVSLLWRINPKASVPVMASALQPKSYALCGELADGAISWMSPLTYLTQIALPALQRGAASAGREPPPLDRRGLGRGDRPAAPGRGPRGVNRGSFRRSGPSRRLSGWQGLAASDSGCDSGCDSGWGGSIHTDCRGGL